MFLIDSQKYDQAKKAFEKMITDFSGDPNLPATVYWIAEKYKWSDRPEESSRICGMIIQKYPDTYWAGRAMLGVSRVDAMSLSTSKNYQEAQNAIDKLAVDYAENPDLPQTIYWIAEKYKWSFNFTEANRVYQQVIQKYPDSVWAENAKLGIATSDVLSLVITGEYERAQASLDKLVVDYAKHPNLPRLIMVVGEQYYKEGLAKDSNGFAAEAKPLFERAVKVWDGLLTTYPNSNVEAEICCWAGDCFYKLGRYEESLQRFLKVVDNYPKYDYVWHAQFMVGYNYEGLKKSGVISKEQADPMIRAAYTELLEKYPTCNAATIAQDWINQNNSK
jgi:TolA-binding protein